MNPVLFLVLAASGYWWYKNKQKKDQEALTEGDASVDNGGDSNLPGPDCVPPRTPDEPHPQGNKTFDAYVQLEQPTTLCGLQEVLGGGPLGQKVTAQGLVPMESGDATANGETVVFHRAGLYAIGTQEKAWVVVAEYIPALSMCLPGSDGAPLNGYTTTIHANYLCGLSGLYGVAVTRNGQAAPDDSLSKPGGIAAHPDWIRFTRPGIYVVSGQSVAQNYAPKSWKFTVTEPQ